MKRISIPLSNDELGALADLAIDEHRDTREQAAVIIRAGLIHRGYLRVDGNINIDTSKPGSENLKEGFANLRASAQAIIDALEVNQQVSEQTDAPGASASDAESQE